MRSIIAVLLMAAVVQTQFELSAASTRSTTRRPSSWIRSKVTRVQEWAGWRRRGGSTTVSPNSFLDRVRDRFRGSQPVSTTSSPNPGFFDRIKSRFRAGTHTSTMSPSDRPDPGFLDRIKSNSRGGGGSSPSDPSFLDKIKSKLGGRTIIPVPIPIPSASHDSPDPSFLDKIKAKLGIGHQNLEFQTPTTHFPLIESTTTVTITTLPPFSSSEAPEPGFFGKAFAKLKSMLNIGSTDPAKPNLVVKYGKKAVEKLGPKLLEKIKKNFHGTSSFFSTDDEFPTQLQNFEGRTQSEIRTLKEKVERMEKLIEGLQSILMKEWNQTESGSKYRLFEERKNWDNAEKHCQGFGAHLAIIDNEAKNTFVTNLISSSETSDFAWIGMKTKTTTQTSTPFTNFDSENPIDGCAVLDSKGVWSIRSCVQLRPFVCQIIKTDLK